MFTPILFMR